MAARAERSGGTFLPMVMDGSTNSRPPQGFPSAAADLGLLASFRAE